MVCKKYWLFGGVLSCFLSVNPVYGQVIPDDTTSTSIINACQDSCDITGGTVAGDNLFHSFSKFNVRTGESVYFTDPGVTNIFSRVTGSDSSSILGTLGVLGGDANLWLLNPNGIIFGEGAALDVGGSFVATTADEIQFGHNNSFSAIPHSQENLALLTIAPSALFFNQMGQNHPIEVNSGTILSVPTAETITLLGGQSSDDFPGVDLRFGGLLALEGNVNIGAIVNTGTVHIDSNLALSFPRDANQGDISLSHGSGINVSGAGSGNVSIQADDVALTGASNIYASTTGDRDGGKIDVRVNNLTIAENSAISTDSRGVGKGSDINIIAKDSIHLIGNGISALQELLSSSMSSSLTEIESTSINTIALADGESGNVNINSQNLNLNHGAWILATTLNRGDAGNIEIDLSGDITLDSSGLLTGTNFGSTGNAGNLTVNGNNLLIQNSGVISSVTVEEGRGGDINLNIADSIELRQSLFNEFVPTGILANTLFGSGAAGNITISTSRLTLADRAILSSGSGTLTSQGVIDVGGDGGDITINATDSIQIMGISAKNSFSSGIVNSTFSHNSAGNIEIHTGRLNLQDKAIISASSSGNGDSGSLTIVADESIHLSGTGFEDLQDLLLRGISGELEPQNITGGLLTNTTIGKAGNAKITSPSLILENGALISTSTFGEAAGGNIDIAAEEVKVSSSLLASSTINGGNAGNINIETKGLTTSNSGVITTSSVGAGNAGDLKVNATDYIKLIDVNNSSLVFGGLVTNSLGFSYSGNLEVNTKNLTIAGGATISASNGILYEIVENLPTNISVPEEAELNFPREIIINAESIDISGSSTNDTFTSSISSTTGSVFPASNLEINTAKLAISNQAEISVSSLGRGKAGNLRIVAESIFLNSKGMLNASTFSGQGGNIQLEIDDILSLNNYSEIKTDALDFGNGGNIEIDTTFVIAFEASNISANALSGQGGNINIIAKDLFLSPNSQVSASSQLGIDGEINIETFSNSDRNNLVKLPEKIIQADSLIAKSCGNANNKHQQGVFIYTGRGGLPPSLLTQYSLSDRSLIPDLSLPESTTSLEVVNDRSKLILLAQTKVEASSWKVNSQGKVELVARHNLHSRADLFDDSSCPFKQ